MSELTSATLKALFPVFIFMIIITVIAEVIILLKNKMINKVDEKIDDYKISKGICPKCGGKLVNKNGKYGEFIGCSNYPKCRYTKDSNNNDMK